MLIHDLKYYDISNIVPLHQKWWDFTSNKPVKLHHGDDVIKSYWEDAIAFGRDQISSRRAIVGKINDEIMAAAIFDKENFYDQHLRIYSFCSDPSVFNYINASPLIDHIEVTAKHEGAASINYITNRDHDRECQFLENMNFMLKKDEDNNYVRPYYKDLKLKSP